jgi:ribosome maturation factor RimP
MDALEKIRSLLKPILEGTDMFVVNIKIKPINNIKIFIDADNGLLISKSAEVNRKLYKLIEAEQMFPEGDFSLEVSSPGVDEPLVSDRQYIKNIGRTILVTPVEGNEVMGVLKDVKDDVLMVDVKQGKKKEIVQVEIPKSTIKKIVVQIIF